MFGACDRTDGMVEDLPRRQAEGVPEGPVVEVLAAGSPGSRSATCGQASHRAPKTTRCSGCTTHGPPCSLARRWALAQPRPGRQVVRVEHAHPGRAGAVHAGVAGQARVAEVGGHETRVRGERARCVVPSARHSSKTRWSSASARSSTPTHLDGQAGVDRRGDFEPGEGPRRWGSLSSPSWWPVTTTEMSGPPPEGCPRVTARPSARRGCRAARSPASLAGGRRRAA